jgi:hypothetical protein
MTYRCTVPSAAKEYDGITDESLQVVRSGFRHIEYPLAEALSAIDADRRNLEAFVREQPKAARDIGDFLVKWRADLDVVERAARAMAASQHTRRPYAHDLNTAQIYGSADEGGAA